MPDFELAKTAEIDCTIAASDCSLGPAAPSKLRRDHYAIVLALVDEAIVLELTCSAGRHLDCIPCWDYHNSHLMLADSN